MLQHHTTSAGQRAAILAKHDLAWGVLTENERLMLCYLEERYLPDALCAKVRPFREVVIREA